MSDGVASQKVPEFACEMSTSWNHHAAHVCLLLAPLLVATGCGATGLDWVAESEASVAAKPAAGVDLNRPVPPPRAAAVSIPATAEQEPAAVASDAHPRLSHTVTLGEIDVQSPNAPPASGPAGVSVTINNYTTVGAPGGGYGYASFGYGRGASTFYSGGSAARSSSPSASGPQAGQSWPAVADHGSSFPYRSAPASPWARAQ